MKQKLPIVITENGIHCTLHGDYYFPDISATDSHTAICHYGRMRNAYLEEHRPGLYTRLILSGKLYEHLAEIDACCIARMDRMIRQRTETEEVNEKLKASDQLGWISRMNSIRQQVEEIVLDELVFS